VLGDTKVYGGGRVVIVADSLILKGKTDKILADAYPRIQNLSDYSSLRNGGSGGYIYIKVNH
jgi:hypothetical protein